MSRETYETAVALWREIARPDPRYSRAGFRSGAAVYMNEGALDEAVVLADLLETEGWVVLARDLSAWIRTLRYEEVQRTREPVHVRYPSAEKWRAIARRVEAALEEMRDGRPANVYWWAREGASRYGRAEREDRHPDLPGAGHRAQPARDDDALSDPRSGYGDGAGPRAVALRVRGPGATAAEHEHAQLPPRARRGAVRAPLAAIEEPARRERGLFRRESDLDAGELAVRDDDRAVGPARETRTLLPLAAEVEDVRIGNRRRFRTMASGHQRSILPRVAPSTSRSFQAIFVRSTETTRKLRSSR